MGSSGCGKAVVCYPRRASAVQAKATQEVHTYLMHTSPNCKPCAPDLEHSAFINLHRGNEAQEWLADAPTCFACTHWSLDPDRNPDNAMAIRTSTTTATFIAIGDARKTAITTPRALSDGTFSSKTARCAGKSCCGPVRPANQWRTRAVGSLLTLGNTPRQEVRSVYHATFAFGRPVSLLGLRQSVSRRLRLRRRNLGSFRTSPPPFLPLPSVDYAEGG